MPDAPVVRAVGCALPPHYADQAALAGALERLWRAHHHNPARLAELHRAVKVEGRYLALPIDAYPALESFAQKNAARLRAAVELGERAARFAHDGAGLVPADVDHVFFTTVTGIATPMIDARLANRLGLRGDVKRTPL